jgi:serine/threonine protein kinase/Tfp pilus assembly protein PilF
MSESHQREAAIFDAAMELPPEQRAAHLDHACGGDAALRRRVESLLKADESRCEFLDSPTDPAAAAPTIAIALPSALEKAGDRIGRYKLLQQIGEGGCGVVYMAEQEEPVCRRVALKIIKLGMDTKSVIARFEAERQALALMDHPNIAKVLDAGATETGRPYFVMELVRGLKITEYCDEARLSTHARLDLFTQVCQAIQHAHQKGIIHRDIKPSNILVSANDGPALAGCPKVIDFGIAKATAGQKLTDKTVFTAFEQFIGTPAYMSPEQAVLTSVDIDTRSDIYALGVLLYELLTGKTPFDAQELLAIGLDEMRRTIREQEPQRPSTRISTLAQNELSTTAQRRGIAAPKLVSELRGDLDWIVMKALEKDRARRYETANGLAMDIHRHLSNEPVVACPPSRLYRLQKMVRRNKLAFAAGSAVTASLVVGLTLSTVLFFRERAARKQATAQAAIARAVIDFLQNDLLRQAGSRAQAEAHFTPDPNLTVRVALERAAERIGDRFKDQPLQEAEISFAIGNAFREVGEAERGIVHLQRSVALSRAKLGPGHPSTLSSMASLAGTYHFAGKLDQALPLLEETLKLRKTTLGPENRDTLGSMNNLALAYRDAGKLDQALPLFEETLKHMQATLPPGDPFTLKAMASLAGAYHFAGKLDQALPLFEETLKLMKATLPPGDPNSLSAMANLADCYRGAGKLDQALPLYEETLKLRKATLQPEHPDTLSSMYDLANCYRDADKLDQALPLFEETLTLRKATLGRDHPETLQSMNFLAVAYREAGELDQALPLFEETLRFRKATLGPDHIDTLDSMYNFASTYREAGKLDQALPLFEETLKLRKATLGRDHPHTLQSMNGLALAYHDAAKLDQALPLHEETLKLRKATLGPDHRETLGSMCNLAMTYRDAGKPDQALPLLEETLKLMKAKLQPGDPYTQNAMFHLAIVYQVAGKPDQALPLWEEIFNLTKAKLGPDDPATLNSMNQLADAFLRQHKFAEAEQLFSDAFTPAIEHQPMSAGLLRSRGNLRARRGQWQGAAADFAKAIEFDPGNHEVWHELAPLLVASGELEVYREHCRKSAERFGKSSDPFTAERIAKDCLILPASGADLDVVAKMADTAAAITNHWATPWFQLVKGLAEYRQGRLTAAVEWMNKALTEAGKEMERDVQAYMVLAMAQYQLKLADEAQAAFVRGAEIERMKLLKFENGDLGGYWQDWIIAHALMREARAMIQDASETKAQTK